MFSCSLFAYVHTNGCFFALGFCDAPTYTCAILRQVELRDLFKNQDATEFCIVTIPTQLAIAESKRLLEALNTQGVAVRNIVVNQVRIYLIPM